MNAEPGAAAAFLKHAAIIVALLAVFYFLAKDNIIQGPYTYDEADYMYAVSLGFGANYFDSPTMPLVEFLKLGMGRGRDASQRTELSEYIRNRDDMVFYRHWHGTLYIDWLSLLKPYVPNENAMRACNYAFPIAATLLMYFRALWLLPGAAGQVAAILAASLYLWSYPVINSTELAPHHLFAVCVIASLLCLAKLMAAGERRYWYAAVVASALAFCLLEVAFALIATLLICGHAVRDRVKPGVAFLAKSAGAFLVTVLVVWPGAILKLSFVKAYLFMAYLAIFRKGAWGSNVSLAETWWLRFEASPVPWILLAVAIYLLLFQRKTTWSPLLLPFVIYAVSMFLAIFKVNTETPRYVLPLFPAIVLLAAFTLGLALARFSTWMRYGTVAVICAAMVATTLQPLAIHRPHADPNLVAMLALVRDNNLSGKRLLVPHGDQPMIHYYFPRAHLKPYLDESAIAAELRGASFDGVIYQGDPPVYRPVDAVR